MDKVTRQCPQTTTFLKRKESRSGTAYQPNALPLGHTGSLFFFFLGRTRLVFICVLVRYVASTVLLVSTQTFRRALTASVDRCVEIYNYVKSDLEVNEEFRKRCDL